MTFVELKMKLGQPSWRALMLKRRALMLKRKVLRMKRKDLVLKKGRSTKFLTLKRDPPSLSHS